MSASAKSRMYVDYEVQGSTARVTLNSPHNRNALSSTLVEELHQALRDAAADPKVRAVVLGHTGSTFCAGADLSEASGSTGRLTSLQIPMNMSCIVFAVYNQTTEFFRGLLWMSVTTIF